jgi:hypothetical protein
VSDAARWVHSLPAAVKVELVVPLRLELVAGGTLPRRPGERREHDRLDLGDRFVLADELAAEGAQLLGIGSVHSCGHLHRLLVSAGA